MLISEVCSRTGLTRKAVRYYVEQRLIAPDALPNGYLDFSDAQLERLRRIAVLRQLGLSTADVLRALDSGAAALRDIALRNSLSAQARARREAILAQLARDMDYASAAQMLEREQRRDTIAARLLDAFPGYFGRFLCLHFGAFLGDEIASD